MKPTIEMQIEHQKCRRIDADIERERAILATLRRVALLEAVYEVVKGHTKFEGGVDVSASCKLCRALAALDAAKEGT